MSKGDSDGLPADPRIVACRPQVRQLWRRHNFGRCEKEPFSSPYEQ